MSKTRKILSIVLAVVLVVALAVPAFAIDSTHYEADDNTYLQEWSLSAPQATANANEYTIYVSLKTDYKTGPIEFVLDLDGVTLTDVAVGDAFYKDEVTYVSKSVETGTVMLSVNTKGEDYIEAKTIEGVIAVLTVTGTSGTVGIVDEPKNKDNPGGTLIAARVDNGDYVSGTLYIGQNDVTVGDAVTIGGAEEVPTLAVIDGAAGVIDTTRTAYSDITSDDTYFVVCDSTVDGYIYGVNPYNWDEPTFIEDVFKVTGDGYLNIVANEAGCDYGTGTLVQVCDSADNVVATYALVIFGDLNGDGDINEDDVYRAELNYNYLFDTDSFQIENELVLFAADVDANEIVDEEDIYYMELDYNYIVEDTSDGQLSQADVAALYA